ncbi:hypothetical protein OSB04_019824 [Centaurea solstitialis]|uniref:CCHC-type domain-containing protein n=1 Tax=Centaurea solstitialis TaxID=347529 RepID=A0AA38WG91_9ASTR|nr:hypothetical protein OSB04_019824 [Centaurea solstitialis]
MLKEEFCPRSEIQKLEAELWHHEMKGSDISTYTTRFHELAQLVPYLVTPEHNRVDRYVWGSSSVIRGNVTAADPQTLQEAVNLATRLTNNAIRSGTFGNDSAKGKRKMEEPVKGKFGQRINKDRRVTRIFGIQTPTLEKGKGQQRVCDRCQHQHLGRCITCFKCNQAGHVAHDCKMGQRRTCFECGSPDHYRSMCPKRNQRPYANPTQPANQGNHGGLARGRAFVVGAEEAKQNPDGVTGTFLLNNYPASVLFDSGADRSYVSLEFRPKINKKSQNLREEHIIEYSNGELVKANKVVKKCTLSLAGKNFRIDLILIKIWSFDIIIGMDWMSNHRATIYCAEKIVMIALPEGGVLEVHGEKPKRDIKIVSYMKMRSHLRKECVAFMAHVVDKEAKQKQIQDIPVVREFPEVFPEELPGLPPHRQVEFHIDLVPGAAPVAKSPYRLAPSEMQELSNQLQELLDKGFIRPSSSPWGAPILLRVLGHAFWFDKRSSSFHGSDEQNDILIYSQSKKDHVQHLRVILELLKAEKLYAKFSKYEFWIREVHFLGYYRRFIANFSKIAQPLTTLTQKDKKFVWGEKQEEAFQLLKHKLCNAPILALPEGTDNFVVYCDASHQGLIWRPWNGKVRKKARKREKCTKSIQEQSGVREFPDLAPPDSTKMKTRVDLSVWRRQTRSLAIAR